MILSDMPQAQKGSWFLHYRDKMDVELIKTIEATVYEIWRTKERIRALNANGEPASTRFLPFGRSYFMVDTLYIGCENFPFHDSFSLNLSGVI